MTVGFALSYTLNAGIHIDSGPTRVRGRLVAAWGKTEVFVAHIAPWDLTRVKSWRHTTNWSLWLAPAHRAVWALRLGRDWQAPYGELRRHRLAQRVPYGDARLVREAHHAAYSEVPVLRTAFRPAWSEVPTVRARLRLPWGELGRIAQALRMPYWLTARAAAQRTIAWAITDTDPMRVPLRLPWSLLDGLALQAVSNTPELTWRGRTLRLLQAQLSCDEDSPVWIAQLELAELADFAAVAIGDELELALGQERFMLMVDGKSLSREAPAEQRLSLSAVSPLARLDAPFAAAISHYEPGAVPARGAVEAMLGPVDWRLPDWLIPAGRLLLEGVTPLAAARHLVAAIGGIVESNPDGTALCRRRHPVSVPDYPQAAVAHSLFDTEVLTSRAQVAPLRGYNRVTVANEEAGDISASDRVEHQADPDDPHVGLVRAWLATPRPVRLVHTGHPATAITALGEQTAVESETVEFVEGRASVRYPVTTIVAATWQHADLGPLAASGTTLSAATPGYSLLQLAYTTTAQAWTVALAADEEVQFVLVDA